jgi:hypothetical protein
MSNDDFQFDSLFYDPADAKAPAIPSVIAREILIDGVIESDAGRYRTINQSRF